MGLSPENSRIPTSMFFLLKKIISTFLLPLPFGLFWILIGIILILSDNAKRFRIISLYAGFFIIFIFSLNPVSAALLKPLQTEYKPLVFPPKNVDKIVVLGGGVNSEKNYPPNLMLGPASLSRLIEGIRIFQILKKENPKAKLILSGGRVFQSPAVADKMKN